MSERSARVPRVVLVTDLATVTKRELFARIAGLSRLESEDRARVAVLLRDKDLAADERRRLAVALRDATTAVGARLLVALDLELAEAVRADGLHLPSSRVAEVGVARHRLGDGALLTVAAHDEGELLRGAAAGADACLYSPIFPSPGKGTPLGTGALTRARAALDAAGARAVSLIALGGVDRDNARACFAAGADGVAAIRADLSDVCARD